MNGLLFQMRWLEEVSQMSRKHHEVREQAMQISEESAEEARAKAARRHCAWHMQGTARRPVYLKQGREWREKSERE